MAALGVDAPGGGAAEGLVFRLGPGTPQTLALALGAAGWRAEAPGEAPGGTSGGGDGWNLWWKGSQFRAAERASLRPWQRLNHFPGAALITKKDKLVRRMRECRATWGPAFSFVPDSFIMPSDYARFAREHASGHAAGARCPGTEAAATAEDVCPGTKETWICKVRDIQPLHPPATFAPTFHSQPLHPSAYTPCPKPHHHT